MKYLFLIAFLTLSTFTAEARDAEIGKTVMVRGKLIFSTGTQMAFGKVSLCRFERKSICKEAVSGIDGMYYLHDVTPGTYNFYVNGSKYELKVNENSPFDIAPIKADIVNNDNLRAVKETATARAGN